MRKELRKDLLSLAGFILLCAAPVGLYYLRNGVLL